MSFSGGRTFGGFAPQNQGMGGFGGGMPSFGSQEMLGSPMQNLSIPEYNIPQYQPPDTSAYDQSWGQGMDDSWSQMLGGVQGWGYNTPQGNYGGGGYAQPDDMGNYQEPYDSGGEYGYGDGGGYDAGGDPELYYGQSPGDNGGGYEDYMYGGGYTGGGYGGMYPGGPRYPGDVGGYYDYGPGYGVPGGYNGRGGYAGGFQDPYSRWRWGQEGKMYGQIPDEEGGRDPYNPWGYTGPNIAQPPEGFTDWSRNYGDYLPPGGGYLPPGGETYPPGGELDPSEDGRLRWTEDMLSKRQLRQWNKAQKLAEKSGVFDAPELGYLPDEYQQAAINYQNNTGKPFVPPQMGGSNVVAPPAPVATPPAPPPQASVAPSPDLGPSAGPGGEPPAWLAKQQRFEDRAQNWQDKAVKWQNAGREGRAERALAKVGRLQDKATALGV